jgi:hypothetical protein
MVDDAELDRAVGDGETALRGLGEADRLAGERRVGEQVTRGSPASAPREGIPPDRLVAAASSGPGSPSGDPVRQHAPWRTAKEVRTRVLDDEARLVPLVIPRQERPDTELETKPATLGVALPPKHPHRHIRAAASRNSPTVVLRPLARAVTA